MTKSLPAVYSSRCFLLIAAAAMLSVVLAPVARLRAQAQNGSPTQANGAKASADEARKTFETICAGCHGLDGHGGERGPDIATRQEVRQRSNAELLEILSKGRLSRGMPAFASLGEENLRHIVDYLRSLQGVRDAATLPGDSKRGKALFFGKAGCSECHMIGGAGGFLGSDLSRYGSGRSAEDIRSAILNVNKNPAPRSRVLLVTLRDSQTLTGLARNEDNFTLQLQSFDGAFHLLRKSDLAHIEVQPHTPMPSGYDALLTPGEMDDLIKYLAQAGSQSAKSNSANQGSGQDEDDQ